MRPLSGRHRHALAPGINLTPLLDALFNLVFFFLLATSLRTEDVQTEITLPQSSREAETAPELPVVSLDQTGSIYYDGRPVVIEELELALQALSARGESEIMIRGDQDVGLGRVYEIMDLARRAGLEAVSLQAESAPPADRPEPAL